MATSGTFSTNNDRIKYTISITQNSRSVSNNTSNVTVSVRFYRTDSNHTTYGTGTVYCKINGTQYSASVTPSQKITQSGIVLFTKTLNISHNSDGSKTLTCSAWIEHDEVSSVEQSYSHDLTAIPRKSSMSVSNGTLGTAQTLTVDRKSSSFTHTITYTCGSASGTIVTKSTSTSISFTPPLDLAKQNTTGTSVSIKYTIITYNNSTSIGSNSYTKTCSIPSSVKPTCSVTVSDGTGKSSTYGGYIQGISTFKIEVKGTPAQGSPIASYSAKANGSTYTKSSFTTGVIANSGGFSIVGKVTDKRGRSSSQTVTGSVLAYSAPQVTKLSVTRCNEDGTANDQGSYVKVVYSYTYTSLSNKNKLTLQIKYKKTTESSYTIYNVYTDSNESPPKVDNSSYIFKADTGSSYNVQVYMKDNFKNVTRSTSVSTGFTLMHWKANGRGMAVGKISEKDDTFEVGMKLWSKYGHVVVSPVSLPSNQDLNELLDYGYYIIPNTTVGPTITNKPDLSTTATALIEVLPGGDGMQLIQRFTQCDKDDQYVWQRCYYTSSWGGWQTICGGMKKITFTPNTNISINRYSISRSGDIVTMYANLKSSAAINKGVSTLFGSIPTMFAPTGSVATTGIQGSTDTCVCWIKNDGSINVRPGAAYSANSVIEFNLTWNITAPFITP